MLRKHYGALTELLQKISILPITATTTTTTTTTATTTTIVVQLFWILSGTTQMSCYQKGKTRKVKPFWIYWSKR